MAEQDILIQEGMNLLYSGMTVVFTFLVLLIISVNVLRIIFSSTKEHALDSNDSSPATVKNEIHHKIIKEVLGGIRS
tara:strand:+ start:989 stop:1219 length:231 start_codon:yes stop_codon:yes gene_type:complete